MKLFIQCVAGVVLSGACTLHASAPCRVAANSPIFLKPIPSSAVHHLQAPHIRLWESTSLNWSGYAAATSLTKPESGVVTDVSGSWIVPAVTGSGRTDTYSSAWIGIDGYSSSTVEQIGTEQDWTPSGKVYYAWIEMYPEASYEIANFPVKPGDVITAQVAYVGETTTDASEEDGFSRSDRFERGFGRSSGFGRGGRPGPAPQPVTTQTFQLTITNVTEKVTYTTPVSMSSTPELSSAEWVVEAPSSNSVLPLADFGTASFSGCQATIGGVTGPINDKAWTYDPLTMATSNGTNKAVPSALSSGGEAFTVTWSHQ